MGLNIRDIKYFMCHAEITANARKKKIIFACADTLLFIYPDKLAATVIIIISWL